MLKEGKKSHLSMPDLTLTLIQRKLWPHKSVTVYFYLKVKKVFHSSTVLLGRFTIFLLVQFSDQLTSIRQYSILTDPVNIACHSLNILSTDLNFIHLGVFMRLKSQRRVRLYYRKGP